MLPETQKKSNPTHSLTSFLGFALLSLAVFGCGGGQSASNLAQNLIPSGPSATPSVTGLSSSSTPAASANWSWSCSESSCSYRYAVDRSNTWTPTGSFGSTASLNYGTGAGTYYLHVQAQDASGSLSSPVTVSAVIDPPPAQAASVGTSAHGLGISGQRHTFLDSLTGNEWIFFLDSTDTTNIETLYNDGTGWQNGPAIALPSGAPHSSEGTQIAVDYRVLGGNGIAYVMYQYFSGNTVSLYENRLQISGTTLAAGGWSASLATTATQTLPPTIGLSVSLLESGRLAIASTALNANENFFVFNSNEFDDGTTGVATFGTAFDIATVDVYTRHAAIFSSTADSAITVSDDAAPADTEFNNFYNGSFLNGTWTSPSNANINTLSNVFMMPTNFSGSAFYEDWAVAKVTDTEMELVTRVDSGSPGALLHYRYTGGAWVAGDSIPNLAGVSGSGLALTSDGTNAWLFAIASDSANSVQYIKWTQGTGWDSNWSILEGSNASRVAISSAEFQGSGGVFYVNWIESSGALMSKLFGL